MDINTLKMNELELNFDLNLEDFADNFIDLEATFSTRYIKPPKTSRTSERFLKYQNAQKLAREVDIDFGDRVFVVVDGSFYFGDYIEALLVEKKWQAQTLTISTLTLNENNVDSLYNLMKANYVKKLNLIISDYFYSHARHTTVKYIYEKLDFDNRFQLASASTHCKMAFFDTHLGHKVCTHGSANLRSSSNIEQFQIEENPALYDFNAEIQNKIIQTYQTINHDVDDFKNKKSVRRKKLWQSVNLQPLKEPQPLLT